MKGSRGYSVIEVMMALGVLAVGTTGVIALQKVSLVGNTNARMADAARQVAGTWVERLKSDSLQWNDPMGMPDLADTRWLNVAGVYNAQNPPNAASWVLAPEIPNWSSPLADVHGADSFSGAPVSDGVFCTHLQLARAVEKPYSLGGQTHPIAIRAIVRVVWRRDLSPMTECRTTAPADIETNDGRYGFYYVSTMIGQEEASN
ncbi:MAG: prepilin-type cleavage/methylation domain-containing protein [Polyangiaceae bacterium]|nr:prepilin-type cleavage/methylation domain-containing protein [Polyangiaceae bacterium]